MCSASLLYIDSFVSTNIHRNPYVPPEGPALYIAKHEKTHNKYSTKKSMFMGDSYLSGPLHTVLVLSL
jgi:hypothetical protein